MYCKDKNQGVWKYVQVKNGSVEKTERGNSLSIELLKQACRHGTECFELLSHTKSYKNCFQFRMLGSPLNCFGAKCTSSYQQLNCLKMEESFHWKESFQTSFSDALTSSGSDQYEIEFKDKMA